MALVWLCIVQLRVIWFGTVWFGSSYANLKRPHLFKHQISGKNLFLHLSKCSKSYTLQIKRLSSLYQLRLLYDAVNTVFCCIISFAD